MLIAVDHGNKQIKTVHTPPFTSGLIQSDTPGFGTDALAYRGKYYTLTDQRIPYRRDKTEDERFFILTLFAIAHEIEAMEQYARAAGGRPSSRAFWRAGKAVYQLFQRAGCGGLSV